MKAMLGISCLSQLAIMLCLSYYCLFLLFKRTGEMRRTGLPGSRQKREMVEVDVGGGRGEMTQTMFKKSKESLGSTLKIFL
jgi:hypothetical protein